MQRVGCACAAAVHFVIFGEPDIEILEAADGQIQVQIHGVDVFHPQSGKVESSEPDKIAIWFIDTDYNSESFFVRHAYFLGANDPYKSLETTLKAEIDAEAWFASAQLRLPAPKKMITIRLDEEIVDWFKQQGRGYQTKINAVLKMYVEQQIDVKTG